jgi:hypothetical protein
MPCGRGVEAVVPARAARRKNRAGRAHRPMRRPAGSNERSSFTLSKDFFT